MYLLIQVQTASEAQHWLCTGLANRASGETAMNQQSSRSHCLLCVRITGRSKLTGAARSHAAVAFNPHCTSPPRLDTHRDTSAPTHHTQRVIKQHASPTAASAAPPRRQLLHADMCSA